MRPKQISSQKAFRMKPNNHSRWARTHNSLEVRQGVKLVFQSPFTALHKKFTEMVKVQVINVSVHLYQKISKNSLHLAAW